MRTCYTALRIPIVQPEHAGGEPYCIAIGARKQKGSHFFRMKTVQIWRTSSRCFTHYYSSAIVEQAHSPPIPTWRWLWCVEMLQLGFSNWTSTPSTPRWLPASTTSLSQSCKHNIAAVVVVVEQGLTSYQTHYRSYRRRVLWVKRPNQHKD